MENIGHYLDQMRSASPLVHNITNFVAMNSMANVLLSAGASPAMVHSLEEVEDFAAISNALTVNIGTLEPAWVEAMCKAAKQMNSQSKPWVFDPVGVGATKYRQQSSNQLLPLKPTLTPRNASEIMALASVVAVTGAIDIVTDGERIVEIPHGSYFMSKVTTMGCSLNGVIAAFCIGQPSFEATVSALTYYGIAGEIAENKCNGPGSFWVEFIDTLASLSGDAVTSRSQVTS